MSESTTVLVQTETVGATVIVTGATVIGTVPIGPQGPPGVITADDVVDLFTGTPDGTKFLRDDGTLAAPAGGGGGAPDDATYLVTTAHAGLSAEVAVGATPGGELGGTWASPTVDATHSGSSHAGVQAAAEATAQSALDAHLNDTADAHDASAISIVDAAGDFTATDVEGALAELQADHEADATALSDHAADTTSVHGIADMTALALTADVVTKALFDANTILAADSDNTPAALPVAEQRLVGRITAGVITGLTAAQVRTLINVEDGATADQSAAEILAALLTVDGAGSGLDADLLDGQSSAAFATASGLSDHLADTTDAHDASAISVDSTTLAGTGTDVQAVLEELDNGIADHLADATAAHAASAIAFTPAGTIAATTVQAAIEEVASEAGAGGAIRVEDEGSSIVAAATGINFAGAGVTVTDAGSNEALVTIPGGSGGLTFKQTVYTGTTNPTRGTNSFADIDATLFPALSLTLAVGDVVELMLRAAFKHSATGNVVGFDWLIDRPTSADTTIRANGTKAAAWLYEWSHLGNDVQTLTPTATFVCTEAGAHTFKPQWCPFGGTATMLNTDANYFTAAIHRVTNLGPVTA